MLHKILVILTLLAFFSCQQQESPNLATVPVDYVNPQMGTLSDFNFSTGNTYPAIARPWGMNFWAPQTGKMGNGWMYTYGSKTIRGFKQTHQPSPWINDYGQFSTEHIEHVRTFYSSLYRVLLFPRKFYEFDANHEMVHYTDIYPTMRGSGKIPSGHWNMPMPISVLWS